MSEQPSVDEHEFQQVDYEESGEEPQDDYHHHDFLNSDHPSDDQYNHQASSNSTGRRVLPPDENGDIIVPNVLFVSRFKLGTTNELDVRKHFDRYGPIKSVVIRYKVAFVEFENDEDAKLAKHDAHFKPGLGTDSLIVDFRKDNKVKPRPDEFNRSHRDNVERFHPTNDDRYGPSMDRRGLPPPSARRYEDRYPPSDPYPPARGDYYPEERISRPISERPDSRVGGAPFRENRSLPPSDYPPNKYGAPPLYPEDRKIPPSSYSNAPPPAYRESRGPPPNYSAPPHDYGRSHTPYDDRRGPYPPLKRPYDGEGDYPPYNSMRGPPPSRDYHPPRSYSDRPPLEIHPRGVGVELSSYAAGASRHRDWSDDGNYKSRHPMEPNLRPNSSYPPNRYDEPPRPPMRGDYPPPRDNNYDMHRSDYRGVDNYQSKRPRY